MRLKLISLLTALFLAFTLVTCSSSEEVKEDNEGETEVVSSEEPSTDRSMTVPDSTAVQNAIKDYDRVFFGMDSTTLGSEATRALDMQADLLNKFPSVKVTLEGHADRVGGSEYNMGLSEKRAQAVKSYLVNKGVASDRITTVGRGQEEDMRAVITKPGM